MANDDLVNSHSQAAIQARLQAGPNDSYLKDFVYGAIDGAVTTFAVVSGVAGAELSTNIVVILGTANLVGDGFSMAASNYLGVRAENQQRERLRRIEEDHIHRHPEGEREEIRQILQNQGFESDDLERATKIITADRGRWIQTMLKEEYGLALSGPVPVKAAGATFVAFLLIGLFPLLPFLYGIFPGRAIEQPYQWSTVMTAAAFFLVGAAKSRFVDQKWYLSGLETLAVGGSAAALAYFCGGILKGVV